MCAFERSEKGMKFNMRNKNRFLFIFITMIILAIILAGVLYLEWKSTIAKEEIVKNFDTLRGYKVFQLSSGTDKIKKIMFFITNSKDIVVDTRIVETGYENDEIEDRYNELNSFLMLVYNVEKNEDYIIYNDNIYNSKSVHDIIKENKKDDPNLIVREF